MGFSTNVIDSTIRIFGKDKENALIKLKKGVENHPVVSDYVADIEDFKNTDNLVRALTLLSMDCEVEGNDIVKIHYAGGKHDNSDYIWPMLEPFIAKDSHITTQLESGEVETISFGEDCSEEYDDDENYMSENVEEFFDLIEDGNITESLIDNIISEEGGLNFTNYEGDTPLMAVCMNYKYASEDQDEDEPIEIDYLKIIHLLLAKSPDLNVVNEDGDTALSYSIGSKNCELVNLLINSGASLETVEINPVLDASITLDKSMVDLFVKKGFEPQKTDALIAVCAQAYYEPEKLPIVKYLVEKYGCDVNKKSSSEIEFEGELRKGATSLMAASLCDDSNVLNYLLEKGADFSIEDNYKNTALHYCSGQTWIGGDGKSCWFSREDNPLVIQALIKKGANPNARNAAGYSCIDIAKKQGNQYAVELFNN